jgi:hypothetical protein
LMLIWVAFAILILIKMASVVSGVLCLFQQKIIF